MLKTHNLQASAHANQALAESNEWDDSIELQSLDIERGWELED